MPPVPNRPRFAVRLATAAALLVAATAADASNILFGNYDPDARFSPTNGLNIWSSCTGHAMPFTVTEAGYATEVQFPLGNWGIADRGNLVIELMLDYGAAVPGYVSAPNPDAVLASVTEVVTDWAGTHQRRFSIAFAAPVRLATPGSCTGSASRSTSRCRWAWLASPGGATRQARAGRQRRAAACHPGSSGTPAVTSTRMPCGSLAPALSRCRRPAGCCCRPSAAARCGPGARGA
jgi:hypothetical protein